MSSNRLSINSFKIQLICVGTPQQLQKLDYALSIFRKLFLFFTFLSSVRNLFVTLDSSHTFTENIAKLTRSSYIQLRRLRGIRNSASSSTFTSLLYMLSSAFG